MYVNVTPRQYAYLRDAVMHMEIIGDPSDVDHVIGCLCLCALDNGGDFNPCLARVAETKIVVVPEWKRTREGQD